MAENRPYIKLYSYPTSPYAQKVGCYLNYKRLDYEFIAVNPMTNAEIKFTRQRQVPVLQINGQWRKESSELGLWLDALFPQRPIMPTLEAEREKILAVDRWVSNSLIPSFFRRAVHWDKVSHGIGNAWKLAAAVHRATPLPLWVRLMWPLVVKKAGFIVDMVATLDANESHAQMNTRLQQEFLTHLQHGPFLAGQSQPSLADLSAYPLIVSAQLMGMRSRTSLLDDPSIARWADAMAAHFSHNPLLISDDLLSSAFG